MMLLAGTVSLATVKRLHQHSSVNPMESPDVTVYHSQERCRLCLVIHSHTNTYTTHTQHTHTQSSTHTNTHIQYIFVYFRDACVLLCGWPSMESSDLEAFLKRYVWFSI